MSLSTYGTECPRIPSASRSRLMVAPTNVLVKECAACDVSAAILIGRNIDLRPAWVVACIHRDPRLHGHTHARTHACMHTPSARPASPSRALDCERKHYVRENSRSDPVAVFAVLMNTLFVHHSSESRTMHSLSVRYSGSLRSSKQECITSTCCQLRVHVKHLVTMDTRSSPKIKRKRPSRSPPLYGIEIFNGAVSDRPNAGIFNSRPNWLEKI